MRTRSLVKSRPGTTIIEVLVAISCGCIILFLVMVPALTPRRSHCTRQIKDSTQIRGVHQGMVLFAASNRDKYPMPSIDDKDNKTIAAPDPSSKDTTANIYSMLIYGNYFSPELMASPAEQSANIEVDTDYHLTTPPNTIDPANALWDPTFAADFTNPKVKGNTSYAHHFPAADRHDRWNNTLQSNEAIVGNRGPQITAVDSSSKTIKPQFAIPNSVTLSIHGSRTTWEGNIAYNDNHVNFETNVFTDAATYPLASPTPNAKPIYKPDVFFFDEPDANNRDNAFMSIFTKAGPTTNDFSAIWD
ncbi:MAG: hypothetical protein U0640_05170 [Phycisphaerales bacterium]